MGGSSSSNPHPTIRIQKMILKFHKEFYLLNSITITALICECAYTMFANTLVYTIRLCADAACRVFLESCCRIPRVEFNLYLPCCIEYRTIRDDQLLGSPIVVHMTVNISEVIRRVVLRRSILIIATVKDRHWGRFNPDGCTHGQDVESQDKNMKKGETNIDRWLYLIK
jgi:hypothetical protein